MIALLYAALAAADDTGPSDASGDFAVAVHLSEQPYTPFTVRRFFGLSAAYYPIRRLGLGARLSRSPDGGEGDLKPLVGVLVEQAHQGSSGDDTFVQPIDKIALEMAALAEVIPLAADISQSQVGFDLHFVGGISALWLRHYAATYDEIGAQLGDV